MPLGVPVQGTAFSPISSEIPQKWSRIYPFQLSLAGILRLRVRIMGKECWGAQCATGFPPTNSPVRARNLEFFPLHRNIPARQNLWRGRAEVSNWGVQ